MSTKIYGCNDCPQYNGKQVKCANYQFVKWRNQDQWQDGDIKDQSKWYQGDKHEEWINKRMWLVNHNFTMRMSVYLCRTSNQLTHEIIMPKEVDKQKSRGLCYWLDKSISSLCMTEWQTTIYQAVLHWVGWQSPGKKKVLSSSGGLDVKEGWNQSVKSCQLYPSVEAKLPPQAEKSEQ